MIFMIMNKIKVLMLGESLLRQGGIVSVQKLLLEQSPPDIEYKHLATLIEGFSLLKFLGFIKALGELIWILQQAEIDLLHTHMSERGSTFRQAITTLIAVMFGKPVVMHTHGPEFHLFYAKLPVPLKQGLSFVFQQCSHFIVLSESWRKYYIDNLGLSEERVTVLPNSIKFPSLIPDRSNRSVITMLFLGRIGHRKGAFDLVQALAGLTAEQKSRSKLIMAGDGDVAELRHLVEQLNLNSLIDVLDWVNSEQRDALLAQADIFLLPSYNEGLPMSVLEAMSWGLPVITTPVGGIPEIIVSNENGLLVNPGDIQQLTMCIQSLLENEKLRFNLGQSARQSIADFDIENYIKSLINIYYSALKNTV